MLVAMTTARSAVRLGIVDTDSGLLRVLANRLEKSGWQHRTFASPVPPDDLVAMRLDALVLDVQILGPQAWTYLGTVCARLPLMSVLVCTGPSTVAQRVRALRLGVDDWIGKPCHPDELLARVEAVVRRRRRTETPEAAEPVVAGGLEIDANRFQVGAGGVAVELTRREFELIDALVAGEGQVLRREEIYERVWGYAMVRGDRSVDVFVRKLRQKLERVSPDWRYIHTHFGIGYRFAAEPIDATGLPAPAPADFASAELGELSRPEPGARSPVVQSSPAARA
jgi:DNA-binding response OmpR family regulator